MSKNSIDGLIKSNRIFEMLKEGMDQSIFYDQTLYLKIKTYVETYLFKEAQNRVAPEQAYFKFIRSYNKDMKAFSQSGKYPLEINPEREILNRYEYNVVLLFSCLFSPHRFRIMQLLDNRTEPVANGLFIGCGPGLEIELVKNKMKNLYAYDIIIDEFIIEKHPEVIFKQEYFDGTNSEKKYDAIYLIEILEHLSDPYDLLLKTQKSLSNDGQIFLTTATNIPQFDHLYNFNADHIDFESWLAENNFSIDFMEDIPHETVTMNIEAKNRFYIISQTKRS